MFKALFSLDFVPRNCCGNWHPFFEYLYLVSNIVTTFCYIGIFFVLILFRSKEALTSLGRTEKTFIAGTYVLFILFCGIGHLENAFAFWTPMYHLFAVWHALTAVVSAVALGVTVKYRARVLIGL